MRDLVLTIDTSAGRRTGVERALRDAIRSGQLPAGSKLPSTRALAADFGLARTTVVAAYEQLAIEGYVIAEQGAGTRVADVAVLPAESKDVQSPLRQSFDADFRPGEPDPSLFPRAPWGRSIRRVLREMDEGVLGYSDPQGLGVLRVALSGYLGRSRAVFVEPDGVSVFGGVTSSMGFIGETLLSLGIDRVGVENPSLFLLRDVLKLVGVTLVPIPVDGEGLDVAALRDADVRAVLVTPGHQFPLGITMTPERRAELIEWAEACDGWIIEDDYDGEFRYDRRSIGSLQGLSPERVIYAGTVSKMLTPGLRLSWLAVPPAFRRPLVRVKHLRSGVSTIDQMALADFIERGDLDRHLRSARSAYQDRQARLMEALRRSAPWLDASPSRAGLHLAATIVDPTIREADVARAAADAEHGPSIGLLGIGSMWIGEPAIEGFILGYSRPAEHQFTQALERLSEFLSLISER